MLPIDLPITGSVLNHCYPADPGAEYDPSGKCFAPSSIPKIIDLLADYMKALSMTNEQSSLGTCSDGLAHSLTVRGIIDKD
ncbi:unnamed protein product [Calypogeia fissa]